MLQNSTYWRGDYYTSFGKRDVITNVVRRRTVAVWAAVTAVNFRGYNIMASLSTVGEGVRQSIRSATGVGVKSRFLCTRILWMPPYCLYESHVGVKFHHSLMNGWTQTLVTRLHTSTVAIMFLLYTHCNGHQKCATFCFKHVKNNQSNVFTNFIEYGKLLTRHITDKRTVAK
jgi:hypothetical protein